MASLRSSSRLYHSAQLLIYRLPRLLIWVSGITLLVALALILALAPLSWGVLTIVGSTGAVILLLNPEIGLYLIAFTVPFGSLYPLRFGSVTLDLSDALVMVIALGWFLRIASSQREHLIGGRLALSLGCFLFTLLLTFFRAENMPEAFKELAKWVECLVILLFITNEQNTVKLDILLASLLVAGTLQGLLGIYQFLSGNGPIAYAFLGNYIRAYGTFGQPNPFGGYMGLLMPLAYSIIFFRWRQAVPGRMGILFGQSVLWWAALISSLVMLAALLMSGSRGALLGLIAGILAVILISGKRVWPLVGLLVLVAIALGPTLLTLVPSAYLARITDIFQFTNVTNLTTVEITDVNFSVIERAAHWLAAWRMFSLHPWLGVGLGQYTTVYPIVAIPRWADPLGHAHNYLLNILAEGGMVACAGYLVFIFSALFSSIRIALSKLIWQRSLGLAATGMWMTLFVHNLFDNLYVHGIYLLVAVIFGIIGALANRPANLTATEETR